MPDGIIYKNNVTKKSFLANFFLCPPGPIPKNYWKALYKAIKSKNIMGVQGALNTLIVPTFFIHQA